MSAFIECQSFDYQKNQESGVMAGDLWGDGVVGVYTRERSRIQSTGINICGLAACDHILSLVAKNKQADSEMAMDRCQL
jgi:hypothetical protein